MSYSSPPTSWSTKEPLTDRNYFKRKSNWRSQPGHKRQLIPAEAVHVLPHLDCTVGHHSGTHSPSWEGELSCVWGESFTTLLGLHAGPPAFNIPDKCTGGCDGSDDHDVVCISREQKRYTFPHSLTRLWFFSWWNSGNSTSSNLSSDSQKSQRQHCPLLS